jgi:hypothetical protein
MYNEQLVEKLTELFGKRELVMFCKIESKKNELLFENRNEAEISTDLDFEAQWWKNKYEELKTLENH